MATQENHLQALRIRVIQTSDENSQQPSLNQRNTRHIDISNRYSSLLSKSVRDAKALEAEDLEPQDVEVHQIIFISDFTNTISSLCNGILIKLWERTVILDHGKEL